MAKVTKVAFTIQRLGPWPGELTKVRRASTFKAGWDDTLAILRHEIMQLQIIRGEGEDVLAILGVAVRDRDVKVDGTSLKADARFDHPGVMVEFPTRHGPMKYHVDGFDHWRDNVRAVALALESLRRVDRYGVTRRGEQYRGFKALPDPNGGLVTPPPMTVEEAAALLAVVSSFTPWVAIVDNAGDFRDAYREAAKRTHPDAGGDPAAWAKLQDAKAVLDRHHEQKAGAR